MCLQRHSGAAVDAAVQAELQLQHSIHLGTTPSPSLSPSQHPSSQTLAPTAACSTSSQPRCPSPVQQPVSVLPCSCSPPHLMQPHWINRSPVCYPCPAQQVAPSTQANNAISVITRTVPCTKLSPSYQPPESEQHLAQPTSCAETSVSSELAGKADQTAATFQHLYQQQQQQCLLPCILSQCCSRPTTPSASTTSAITTPSIAGNALVCQISELQCLFHFV